MAKARDFRGGVAAIDHTAKYQLWDCQLVLCFSNADYNVEIPLSGNDRKRVSRRK